MSCTLHPTRYCVLSSVRVRVKTGWLYTGRTRNLTLFGISTEAASVNSMVPGSNRLTPLYDTSTIFPMIRRSAQLTRQGVRSLRRGYKRLNRCSSAISRDLDSPIGFQTFNETLIYPNIPRFQKKAIG